MQPELATDALTTPALAAAGAVADGGRFFAADAGTVYAAIFTVIGLTLFFAVTVAFLARWPPYGRHRTRRPGLSLPAALAAGAVAGGVVFAMGYSACFGYFHYVTLDGGDAVFHLRLPKREVRRPLSEYVTITRYYEPGGRPRVRIYFKGGESEIGYFRGVSEIRGESLRFCAAAGLPEPPLERIKRN